MIQIRIEFSHHSTATFEVIDPTNPESILRFCMVMDFPWKLDYSRATREETSIWLEADLFFRCKRAIEIHDLPVTIDGHEFTLFEQVEIFFLENCRPFLRLYEDELEGVKILLGDAIH